MDFKKKLLNLLQVRENEWWLVRQLFFQQFFSGAGIALFFTAAFTLFLQKFSINELPKVLIASALMQWITGYLYSKVEHLVSIKNLILIINVFIGASIILFRIAAIYTDSILFFFSMLVWYNVLYLLSSLDFWGLAALLFDVRQSKRLFGIISAGDIPAKFIGYSSAIVLAPVIGQLNMLIAGAAAVLYSLVYWYQLKESGHLDLKLQHHHVEPKHHPKEKFSDAVGRFFQNKLVLNLAILSFLISSIATLIYFIFYAKIKAATHDDTLLGYYIAMFMAFSRGIAIVMKVFFTNRITNRFGIRGSLLITPVVLLVTLLPVLYLPLYNEGVKIVLIIFGLLSVTNDVLRSAILTPVFLSVMQPLRAQVRLRAHNIVKGVMDPFGLLFIGLLLYFMLMSKGWVDLYFLSWVLIGLLTSSIVWIFITDNEYAKMLVVALRNRYFNGNELVIDNKETLSFFLEKSLNGEATDVIFVLGMMGKNNSEHAMKIIDNAMHHPDDHVKIAAIKTIERLHLVSNLEQMKAIAHSSKNRELLYESVKAIYTLTDDKDYNNYLDDANAELMSAAIIGMLRNEKLHHNGLDYFRKLRDSRHAGHRIYATVIIGESNRHSFANDLIELINDGDDEVSKAAIKTSARFHDNEVVKELIRLFSQDRNEKIILIALIENGHHAIEPIREFFDTNHLPRDKRIKLINVIGKIGGVDAKKLLNEMIDNDNECRNEIIDGLCTANFKVEKADNDKYRVMLNRLLQDAALLVLHNEMLNKENRFPLLAHALELELNNYREIILNVFTFFYNSEKIQHARIVFFLNKKENIANALEIIDVTVQKNFAQKFIALYDNTTADQKLTAIKKQFIVNALPPDELLQSIVNHKSLYNNWTKACALYEMDNMSIEKNKFEIKVLAMTGNDLIKETAAYVLEK